MTTSPTLQNFQSLFAKIPAGQQAGFAEALARIAPTAEAEIEWRKRLHFDEETEKIHAGAYLFVRGAAPQNLSDSDQIFALFLENREAETLEILSPVFDALEKEMLPPFDFRMGIPAYIAENQAAFMLTFTAAATSEAGQKHRFLNESLAKNTGEK